MACPPSPISSAAPSFVDGNASSSGPQIKLRVRFSTEIMEKTSLSSAAVIVPITFTIREVVERVAGKNKLEILWTTDIGLFDKERNEWLDDDKTIGHYYQPSHTFVECIEYKSKKSNTKSSGKHDDDHDIFYPPPVSYTEDMPGLIWITADGRTPMPALYLEYPPKGKQSSHEKSSVTVLYSMDIIGEDLGVINPWLRLVSDLLQVNVLCYEYTGYGRHKGVPAETECYADIDLAYAFLSNVLLIPANKIILMGKGVGAGPTLHIAAGITSRGFQPFKDFNWHVDEQVSVPEIPPNPVPILSAKNAALVLLCPILRIRIRHSKLNIFSSHVFDSTKAIPKVFCPTLVIHGIQDELVGVAAIKKLYAMFPSRWKLHLVDNHNHNTLQQDIDEYLPILQTLVQCVDPTIVYKTDLPPMPTQLLAAPSNVVLSWLQAIGMQQYLNNFLSNGYFDMLSLRSLAQIDMEILGVTNESHQQALLTAAAKLREAAPPVPIPKLSTSPTSSRRMSEASIPPDKESPGERRRKRHSLKERQLEIEAVTATEPSDELLAISFSEIKKLSMPGEHL